eukprot:CAMPEP_0197024674 /NCGR_PEP_ID=MMETSP1384-20130603/5178_1 /TAXON_ID=29189 /ORGANISM="Ammonia sp." /LENGTH=509 /DNA_ID=CAMNT_0042453095 /DNA_START=42 /DNA_END=1571 /DNA_ORIENTATION=-
MAELHGLGMMGMRRRKSQSTATIYIDELMEEYTCPICFDEIDKCLMTPCGHNFCEKCIDECLNRKHICPFCSTPCTTDKLIRNVHLDSVLAKLLKARAAASKELISNLMQKTIEESKKSAPKVTSESPIAQIFTKYTSQTLIKYENYYQEMLKENNRNQLKLQDKLQHSLAALLKPIEIMELKIQKQHQPGQAHDDEHDAKMNHHDGGGGNESEEDMEIEGGDASINEQVQELFTNILFVEGNDEQYFVNLKKAISAFTACIKSKQQALNIDDATLNEVESTVSSFYAEMELSQKRLNRSVKLLCDSYEEYMSKTSPSPFLLPVAVTIRLRGRPQFWELKLNMTDRVGVVIDIVKHKFSDLNDPIDQWQGDGDGDGEQEEMKSYQVGLLRPLAERDPEKPLEIITNMEQCLSELNVRQGTQIHVLTTFRLQSEAPRPCFTYDYDKAKGAKCDYYRCTTCKFNWVCAPCSMQCHKGHNLVPFMMGHVPSYACCYCVKKKKCKILNIKSNK